MSASIENNRRFMSFRHQRAIVNRIFRTSSSPKKLFIRLGLLISGNFDLIMAAMLYRIAAVVSAIDAARYAYQEEIHAGGAR